MCDKEMCIGCSQEFPTDEMTCVDDTYGWADNSDEFVCISCEEDIHICHSCNNAFVNSNPLTINDGGTYHFCSRSCLNRATHECENCGCVILTDYSMCEDCENDNNYDDYDDDDEYSCMNRTHPTLTFNDKATKNYLNTKGFHIGMEVEIIDKGSGINCFNEARGLTKSEKALLTKNVGIKDDCSLSSGGVEFYTIPLANDNAYKTLKALSKFYKNNNFVPDKSCGIHLHIGENPKKKNRLLSKNINRHKILLTYALFQDIIFNYACPTRKGNNYCSNRNFRIDEDFFDKSLKKNIKNFYSKKGIGRYNIINYNAWSDHKTLEIRCLHSSNDFEEMINWVKLNVAIFDFAINSSYKKLLNLCGSWKDFKTHILSRLKNTTKYYEKKYRNYTKAHKLAKLNHQPMYKYMKKKSSIIHLYKEQKKELMKEVLCYVE